VKVAVMMAAYNTGRFIEDALASLLRQRADAGLDIIVVNDGSTDGTGDIVRRIAAGAPEVRLIETPNRGIAAARNTAIAALAPDTDLVTILDSDDLSPEGRFARDTRRFIDDPALDFLYATTCMFRGVGSDRLVPDPNGPQATIRGIQLGAAMFRRPFFDRIGPFDETLKQAEDTDFLFRVFEHSPRLLVVDDLSVYYRRHETNVTYAMEEGRKAFARVIVSYTRRRKAGSPTIPPGFFAGRSEIEGIDWW
jgi:glycosyltransferase involved in cell wall biosynthesis